MKTILKLVKTAIFATISNLLCLLLWSPAFCIKRLNTNYIFMFAVNYHCFSLVNLSPNVECVTNVPSVLSVSPTSHQTGQMPLQETDPHLSLASVPTDYSASTYSNFTNVGSLAS